jgi:hypothetical protein
LDKIGWLTKALCEPLFWSKRFDASKQPFECSDEKLFRSEAQTSPFFLSGFVLLTLQSGSIISASSGGQRRKPVAPKIKHPNGGKKLWDYSIQYSAQ